MATNEQGNIRGLMLVFSVTILQFSAFFMLTPLMLLHIKALGYSSSIASLFAACGFSGILLVTPLAGTIIKHLGRRYATYLATFAPILAACGYAFIDNIWVWYALELLVGVFSGLYWVLSEAYIPEFSPSRMVGRMVGFYATMVAVTFALGPGFLSLIGAFNPLAIYVVITLFSVGFLTSLFIPSVAPHEGDEDAAHVGLAGIKTVIKTLPVVLVTGFIGGYFEDGLSAIVPLYGLTMHLSANASVVLAIATGLGGVVISFTCGFVVDRIGDSSIVFAKARRYFLMMAIVSCCLALFIPMMPWLIWVVVVLLGMTGGGLYSLSMLVLAKTQKGMGLVNATAVLVLSYNSGGLFAAMTMGPALQLSAHIAFPIMLSLMPIAALYWLRNRHNGLS